MQRNSRFTVGLIASVFVFAGLLTTSPLAADPAAASGPAVPAKVQVSKSFTADMKHLTKSVPAPKGAKGDAIPAEIDLLFPEFTTAADPKGVAAAINKAVQARLLTMLEGKTADNVEGLMAAFAKEYEETLAKGAELTGGWTLKCETVIRYSDEDLVALDILQTVATGGAHGNSKIAYVVFSLATGEAIPLTAVVPEAKMKDLTQAAEKVFRQAQGLQAADPLSQAGFTFEKDQFALNRNFLVCKDGLAFSFDPGEIGPYAKGPIEVMIPWADLKTIALADGPAKVFLPK